MKKKKIVVIERVDRFIAYFSDHPGTGKWVLGCTVEEAIGKLVLKFAEGIDVEIDMDKSIWDVRARKEGEHG